MDITQLHKIRIASDYKEMCRIATSPIISWVATKGKAPYVEEYVLTIKVRTYSGPDKVMNQCKVRVTLPPDYPQRAPLTRMEGVLVFHPNWFINGTYCCGSYPLSESLGNYVLRMIRSLQYDPQVTNPNPRDAANPDAIKWYLNNKHNKKMFPSDKQSLPSTRGVAGFVVTGRT